MEKHELSGPKNNTIPLYINPALDYIYLNKFLIGHYIKHDIMRNI